MSEAPRAVVDSDVRWAAAHDLSTTFLVEAGAGTGKTRLLVGRYVAAVLAGAAVSQIAAITFTEKAAGELRQKVRERLEVLLAGDPDALAEAGCGSALDEMERARVSLALAELDAAVISTIHAFAARLLRERPVEALVDPGFTQLDEIGADLVLADAWKAWLEACADPASGAVPGRGALAGALAAGVPLGEVRRVAAEALSRRYHVGPTQAPPAPDLAADVEALRGQARRLAELAASCIDPQDRLCQALGTFAAALAALPEAGTCDELGCALALVQTGRRGDLGQKGNWPSGKDEAAAARAAAAAALEQALGRYGDHIAATVLAAAWGFVETAGAVRAAAGALDFDDLLGRARDLVAGSGQPEQQRRAVRSYFQSRFRYLLVDEFQDTDPLQVELVMFLAERTPTARHWAEVELEPGKLFLVGDPKQSIYRFRKADIAIYHAVREVIARQGRVLPIAQSFRAVPGLITWFNRTFAEVIGDEAGELQPGYQAVDAWREATQEGPVVTVLRVAAGGEASLEVTRVAEAAAVAALVAGLAATGWLVPDRAGGGLRPAGPGDVAILFRTLTSLETYERALRGAGVPYQVEGGKSFFKRREVVDTVAALHAVRVPADALGVYAALHGCLFGFADDELLAYRRAGGRFELYAERPPGQAEIGAALDLLRDLRDGLGRASIAATVEALVARTALFELLAAEPGAAQSRANVQQLLDLAAAHTGRPGTSFDDYVRQLRDLQAREEGEWGDGDEADAVRLLTVHKAKGLEFAIVVLADVCGEARQVGKTSVLVRRTGQAGAQLVAGVKLDPPLGELPRPLECRSFAHEAVRAYENDASACEARRLLYVACTRATERLVVPLRLDEAGKAAGTRAGSFAALLAPHLALDVPETAGRTLVAAVDPPASEERAGTAGPSAERAEELFARRQRWAATREAALEAARRPAPVRSPSSLELLDDDLDERPALGRATALGLGGLVHAALQAVSLDDPSGLEGLVTTLALQAGLDEQAAVATELVAACWRSPPVREAAAARCWRELPLAAPVGGVLVEGAADLVYERGTGLVLVDFKTDRGVDDALLRSRYGLQLGAYALALEAATGKPVLEALLVAPALSRPGEPAVALPVTLDDELRRQVLASLAVG